jgi:hypothetical protein
MRRLAGFDLEFAFPEWATDAHTRVRCLRLTLKFSQDPQGLDMECRSGLR